MVQLTRGKTEAQVISFDVNPQEFEELRIRYKQRGRVILEKTEKDVEATSEAVFYVLTPEETGRFNPYDPVYIQIQAVTQEGKRDFSEVIEADVIDIV